jgi:hypothetical protein
MTYKSIIQSTSEVKAFLNKQRTMFMLPTKDNCLELIGYQYVENSPTYPEMWKGKKSEPYTGWVAKFSNLPIAMPRTPPFTPGQIVWVKEAWQHTGAYYIHKADCAYSNWVKILDDGSWEETEEKIKWNPAQTMPIEASRLWLQIETVSAKRIQQVTEEEAKAMGCDYTWCTYTDGSNQGYGSRVETIRSLYPKAWEANLWHWMYGVKIIERPKNI